MRERTHRIERRDAHGFTLVEVLVALVIVAVGMSALLAAMSSAADGTAYLRDKQFAEWVGLNRIAEVRLQRQRPEVGKSTGESEFAGRRWSWEQEVLESEVEGILRIDVRVRPADTPANARGGWLAQLSGVIGDAITPPTGIGDEWMRTGPQETGAGVGPGDDSSTPGRQQRTRRRGQPGTPEGEPVIPPSGTPPVE
jgi:general secretion pathway protein I